MQLEEYQSLASRTSAFYVSGMTSTDSVTMGIMGLCGEAGEVADLIKKSMFHGHKLDLDKLKLELGDVLWYIAALATSLGMSLDEIAVGNIAKLQLRYKEGFSSEASINRNG